MSRCWHWPRWQAFLCALRKRRTSGNRRFVQGLADFERLDLPFVEADIAAAGSEVAQIFCNPRPLDGAGEQGERLGPCPEQVELVAGALRGERWVPRL